MARPTLITVKGQFFKLDGTPESGTVEFRSPVYVMFSSNTSAVVPSAVVAKLDTDGSILITLPATNDPAWSPVGWTYRVTMRLSNDYSSYDVSIPYDSPGGEVNFTDLLPTSPSSGIGVSNNHTHAASAIVSGTIAMARLPVGTTHDSVAYGDHVHPPGGDHVHTYGISDITGLTTALNSKAGISHTHAISEITNLQTQLNSKADNSHTHASSDVTGLATVATSGSYNDLADKPVIGSSAVTSVAGRTGDVVLTKSDVALGNVDNTSDTNKPVSSATQTALNTKADVSHTHSQSDITGLADSLNAKVDSADLATVATSGDYADLTNKPTISYPVTSVAGKTGAVTLVKADVGLTNVDNTTDANKPVSTATQSALDAKAPIASPTFTGTVSGISKAMVGLGNVDNTSDANKPVSTATQSALDAKAPINSPTFTGTVSGVTKSMVGLGNVDNTSDANKPISSATQTALNAKADATALDALDTRVDTLEAEPDPTPAIRTWNGSAYVSTPTALIFVGDQDPGSVPNGSIWIGPVA